MIKTKKLGLFMLIALVTGNMIGAGIFLLPASLAGIGSIGLLAWIITTCGALLLAATFAKLSRSIPKTGGPYAYTRQAFGDFIGFQTAFNYWVTLWTGISAVCVATIGYLQLFIPALKNPMLGAISAIALIWGITFINMAGIRKAGALQLVSTVLKLIPLLVVILFGLPFFHWHNLSHAFNLTGHSTVHALSMGASLTLWAFIGLEAATVPAGSVDNPRRNIPLATMIGVIIVALVYILSATTIMGMIPLQTLAHTNAPFADAAAIIFGPIGRTIIGIGAIISCVGALNGWTLLQGQISMAMSADGLFPRLFAKKNAKGVPAQGMIFTSLLISILLSLTADRNLIHQFNTIILMSTLASLIPYFYTACAAILLYKKHCQTMRSLITHLTIAIFAGIYCFWAILGTGHRILTDGAIILLLSVPLYTWVRYKNHTTLLHENTQAT